MKLWQRRVLLTCCIFIFVTIAPLLVFYATGYRFDLKNSEIRFVGMIDIASTPKDADIFLDDELIEKTPYQIRNLFPRSYTLKLQKEGYHNWEKNLPVESKQVTWVKNARLFLTNPPQKEVLEKPVQDFIPLSQNEKVAYTIKNENHLPELWLFDLDSQDNKKLFTTALPEKPTEEAKEEKEASYNIELKDLVASDNSAALLFTLKEDDASPKYYYQSIKNEESILLSDFIQRNINQIDFCPNEDQRILYLSDNSLYEFDIKEKQENRIAEDVLAFKTSSQNSYFIKKESGALSLYEKSKNGTLNFDKSSHLMESNLPFEGLKDMEVGSGNNLSIIDDKKNLYLFRSENDRLEKIADNVTHMKWGARGEKILFRNHSELSFYEVSPLSEQSFKQDYRVNQSNLITRYGREITAFGWFPDEEWVWVSFDNQFKIIELDERGGRNHFDFLSDRSIDPEVFFGKKGEQMFYQEEDANRIMKMTLFEK
ncbi:PEGA domain-containing protein [Patescibacteria group bacterium]|nr:PEGA domain-containing protein [Patescibacteria group bacterium]